MMIVHEMNRLIEIEGNKRNPKVREDAEKNSVCSVVNF